MQSYHMSEKNSKNWKARFTLSSSVLSLLRPHLHHLIQILRSVSLNCLGEAEERKTFLAKNFAALW